MSLYPGAQTMASGVGAAMFLDGVGAAEIFWNAGLQGVQSTTRKFTSMTVSNSTNAANYTQSMTKQNENLNQVASSSSEALGRVTVKV